MAAATASNQMDDVTGLNLYGPDESRFLLECVRFAHVIKLERSDKTAAAGIKTKGCGLT